MYSCSVQWHGDFVWYHLLFLKQSPDGQDERDRPQSIRHSAEEIHKIAGETGHLSQQKETILENIGSLSAISEENAANNQQVNANIEEILTQIQTVGTNCDKMKQISGELENSVAYFHTEKEPVLK